MGWKQWDSHHLTLGSYGVDAHNLESHPYIVSGKKEVFIWDYLILVKAKIGEKDCSLYVPPSLQGLQKKSRELGLVYTRTLQTSRVTEMNPPRYLLSGSS